MAGISIFADKVALTLFEQHGRSAMVHIEEQVRAAVRKADWAAVKSWRYVGSEVERLCGFH